MESGVKMNPPDRSRVVFVLPSLDPDDAILNLVDSLAEEVGDSFRLLVVNDGSRAEKQPVFDNLAARPYCTLLTHEVNRGKGAALKTAFDYLLKNSPDIAGCVTADGDGQHLVKDIVACADILLENPGSLVLGCRAFSGDHVPWKSRFGNELTKFMFRCILRTPITDTQTGLRGIPAVFMAPCLNIPGNRFEYETQMLLETRNAGVPVQEFTIETVYFDANSGTHFHPVKDAFRIYKVIFAFLFAKMQFLRFLMSSASAWLIDNALFNLFFYLILPENLQWEAPWAWIGCVNLTLFFSKFIARACSSLWNYTVNRIFVFKANPSVTVSIVQYYTLCACILTASCLLLALCSTFVPRSMIFLANIAVDAFLFCCSFFVEKYWIFRKASGK